MYLRNVLFGILVFAGTSPLTAETYRVVLEPKFHTIVSSEVTSTVKKVDKKMGDKFLKGDILMELDDTIFVFNHKKAVAEKHNADTNLNTIEELFKEKSASQIQLSSAQAAAAAAEADLALADKALNSSHIIAPYDGKVQEVFVQDYEHVEAGQKLIDLIDDSELIAKLLIQAEAIKELQIGKVVMVQISEMNKPYPATITHIAPGINPASALIKVDASIDNREGHLRAGMLGIIEIEQKKPIPPALEPQKNPQQNEKLNPQPKTQLKHGI